MSIRNRQSTKLITEKAGRNLPTYLLSCAEDLLSARHFLMIGTLLSAGLLYGMLTSGAVIAQSALRILL